ncbi:hypothetical protein B9479_001735 [Cryptococcus floricola]|uniref:Uncharacterized protein n=1 Tax=Cryptococcus floricola TaxID=2591691 RepID=A0A5D3B646_9TREE|nr:hypothetical protein B9479_001735 [Cryptococcus floricola]
MSVENEAEENERPEEGQQAEQELLRSELEKEVEFSALRKTLGFNDTDVALERLLECHQSIDSLKLFIAAAVNLWETQKATRPDACSDHPRSKSVNSILRAYDRVVNARRVARFEDAGDGTHYDGIQSVSNMQ